MDSTSDESPIPSTFDLSILREPRPLVEYRMNVLSGRIREKRNWWLKVHDADIVSRWRAEMRDQDGALVEKMWGGEERYHCRHLQPPEEGESEEEYERVVRLGRVHRAGPAKQWPRDPISDAELDYVFDELRYDAGRVDQSTGITPASVYGVYHLHGLIPLGTRDALLSAVSILEDVPEDEKDWHPGSNNQVLDLVHPSLYPLRIGHSLAYVPGRNRNLGVVTSETYREQRKDMEYFVENFVSEEYQWLPTDFRISSADADGAVTAIPLGYINSLHPEAHRTLYPVISSILARFVPLWERVLSDIVNPAPMGPVDVDPMGWYSELPAWPDYTDDEAYRKFQREVWWPSVPEPYPFTPPETTGARKITLGGRTLQVIVKLANIVLTPDNPEYPGGSWHVEGMANERIVATGLYYYAMENITESRLEFRVTVGNDDASTEFVYQERDSKGHSVVYGIGAEDALNQKLGSICAEEGKCVGFPNVYQHRVERFELADKSKPGHRKILCFFLVDPYVRILSTSEVPVQREDWVMNDATRMDGFRRLPPELFDIVMGHVRAGTMTRAQAEETREALMEERKAFVTTHNEEMFEVKFNMCEH